jgi:hypothetical protein
MGASKINEGVKISESVKVVASETTRIFFISA